MTTDYTNITLYGVTQDEVISWCEENDVVAYVSPTVENVTVLYENALTENAHLEKPLEALLQLGAALSAELMAPALVTVIADDDMFMYVLFLDGQMADTFMSFSEKPPVNGKPELLVELFDAGDEIERVRAALQRRALSATERHLELMDALVLPPMMIDMGFAYLEEGEKPHGVEDNNDVIYVGYPEDDENESNGS